MEVDARLRVVKVAARGITGMHPSQSAALTQTGCAVVAIERGAAMLVEFNADFAITADDAVYLCGNGESIAQFYKAFP